VEALGTSCPLIFPASLVSDLIVDKRAIQIMSSIVLAIWRPAKVLMLVAALVSGGVLGLWKMGVVTLPPLNAPQVQGYLDYIGVSAKQAKEYIAGKYEAYFHKHSEENEEAHHELRKVVVTSPKVMDVTLTQPFVCQIHSKRHIDVCALEDGYLEAIRIVEGQAVKAGEEMFKLRPILYQAELDAATAEAKYAEIKLKTTRNLYENKNQIVSQQEVFLYEAELAKAEAKRMLAEAKLKFATITAPFDGIVNTQKAQQGSLIKEGDNLTTLSDNSVMWVYFNVPEKYYLAYMASAKQDRENQIVELELANHEKFSQPCINLTVEGQFNNETGNIPFRADFSNPVPEGGTERERVLRHGQTGTILIHRTLKDALVIPQRATFELLDKRYVWVIGEDDIAHQRLITIKNELEDRFVINSGLEAKDKIVLEGVREVEEGGKVEYEFREPEAALKNQKFHAE
jgi:membrane fusion protein, multidrug efflux system